MSYGAKQYRQTNIGTASPEQLILMYYEACIKHVKKAIVCCENGDVAGRGTALGKAHDIVNELSNSLNFEVGGDIARELERLYNYMVEQLLKANAEGSVEPLKTTLNMLETLLSAWRVAVKDVLQQRQGQTK